MNPRVVAGTSSHESHRLTHNGAFMILWGGQTVSQVGSAVTDLALPTLAIFQLGAGAGQVGLLVACSRVPFPLLALPVGAVVDRIPRRPAMIAADAGRCALLGLVPLFSALGVLHLWVLYLVAVAVGSLTVVFDVAYLAYVPALVGTDQLAQANARLSLSSSAAAIGGPGLGGILLQIAGAACALLADALSFAVSALALLTIRRREPSPSPAVHTRLRDSMSEGVRHVFSDRVLRSLVLSMMAMVFFAHMAETALLLFAYVVLHLSPGQLGVVITTMGAGAVVGAVAARPLGRVLGVGPTMAVSSAAGGVLLALMPLAMVLPALPTLLVLGVFVGIQDTVNNIHQLTLRQALTPDRLSGRMTAVFRTAYWGAWPLGNLAGGLFAGLVGSAAVIAVGGAGSACAAMALLFTSAGRIRDLPRYDAEQAA